MLALYVERMVAAKKADNRRAFTSNLVVYLGLVLRQNKQLYAVRAPQAAKTMMAPILVQLHHLDRLDTAAFLEAGAGDFTTLAQTVTRFNTVLARVNRLFASSGVLDCGG